MFFSIAVMPPPRQGSIDKVLQRCSVLLDWPQLAYKWRNHRFQWTPLIRMICVKKVILRSSIHAASGALRARISRFLGDYGATAVSTGGIHRKRTRLGRYIHCSSHQSRVDTVFLIVIVNSHFCKSRIYHQLYQFSRLYDAV